MAIPPAAFRARASLLDRLIDTAPQEKRELRPLRIMEKGDIRAAVSRDLGWLLNTRTPLPAEAFDTRELTVIDYGVPDFGKGTPTNVKDQKLRAARTEKAIRAFEPRLQDVKVSIETEMDSERSLRMTIEAVMVADDVREPVSFMTIYDSETGRMEINADQY
jgi:type VI secretion system protein ImpF